MMRVPEQYRYQLPGRESEKGDMHGAFLVKPSAIRKIRFMLRCIASNGDDWDKLVTAGFVKSAIPWEHVSVSLQPGTELRVPNWEEMCYVKHLFWEEEDAVIQLHPPKSEYVNESRFCLHLWRPVGIELPRPPAMAVGDLSYLKRAAANGRV